MEPASAPADHLKEAEGLAAALGEALSGGDEQEAAGLSQRLSQLRVPVSVSVSRQAYPQDSIRLWVGVEDSQSDSCIPVFVEVPPYTTIAQLKDKINADYGFPPLLQRWVIGKRLAHDRETLYSHGVHQSGDKAFLFILSADAARFTWQQQRLDEDQHRLEGIVEKIQSMQLLPRGLDGGGGEKLAPRTTTTPDLPEPQLGWACTSCTFVNKPTRPGCEICGQERPEDYKVPDVHQPDQHEIVRIQQEERSFLQYEETQQEERERNYMILLAVEDRDLIFTTTETDCPICLSTVEPGEAVVLRECLHSFCRECLHGTIVNSQDAEVSCPDSCESIILDREIKALLTEEEHQRFLELRLNMAESCSEHSFHCQTPNCRGWCIYEDEVNEFYCQICNESNCILCRAIHSDMNCKDYQDDLRIRAENDQAAKQTKQMLESLLINGEAMKCPRCDITVQKKDGCDWICCLMCKTEICWVTKQARWGPKGRGDTSGGCRCRVNNQPCHPNCQNCH
ncbi:ranBP-type and C3HC4-type zinc finger-containing protein 1 [Brachionichthys hirsutus]|uniref:ranBP-type and C3HC4-type zinc finger-containing protein 1 n=1 Tax=Brachionichthys hirsutus TaxID=412623 RepID=UPI003604CB9C